MRLRYEAALATALLLNGCSSGAVNLQSALSFCSSNPAGHARVYVPDARVTRVLGERRSRSGLHEGFVIRVAQRSFTVEDNADITGEIPLRRGDVLSLLGTLECDDGVIHWTHHDPSGHHPTGYIKVNGKLYE